MHRGNVGERGGLRPALILLVLAFSCFGILSAASADKSGDVQKGKAVAAEALAQSGAVIKTDAPSPVAEDEIGVNASELDRDVDSARISAGALDTKGVFAAAPSDPAAPMIPARQEAKKASDFGQAEAHETGSLSPLAITALTYAFTSASGAALEDLSSGSTLVLTADTDDGNTAGAPIGFDFWFDGVRHAIFSVNANGLLKLGPAVITSSSFTNNLTTATDAPYLAPYWDDLWLGNNGKIHYKVVGVAPNRKLVVEWQNEVVPRIASFGNPGAATFQAWLYETTGQIEFVYGSGLVVNSTNGGYSVGMTTAAASFASVTTATNTVSYAAANNTQTTAITSGTKYTFTPNVPAAAPSGLSFTAIGLNTMTLNWTDNSSNEVGFAIYRSLDGVNYEFVRQTAANAVSSVEAGLASNTTYFWRVIATTEGAQTTALSGSAATTTGTVVGTLSIGPTGTFASITAAVASINTNGLAGNVILELEAAYVSGVETFPLVINTLGSPSNTITIRPQAGATGRSITSAVATQTIQLNGATNVTIDGRPGGVGTADLVIANTATAGVAVQLINGASRNTIKFATIQGVNTSATGGVVVFSTAAAAPPAPGATAVTGNNNNTIDSCDVRDGATTPVNGILSLGTLGAAVLNTGNTISNNNVFNFHNATVASTGINVNSNNSAWTISNNRIFQTATRASTAGITHRGILVASANGHDFIITGNVVGFASAGGTGTYTMTSTAATAFAGIQLQAGTSSTSSIQNNTVTAISMTTTTGSLTGISVTGGSANIGTVTGNTVGSGTGNGSLQYTNSTSGGFVVGINVSGATTATVAVANNTVGSITASGSVGTINPNINVLQFSGGSLTISNNLIGSNSTANSIQIATAGTSGTAQQLLGMFVQLAHPSTITGNTVANLTNSGAGTAHALIGIGFQSAAAPATAGPTTISLNNVHDISGANASTSLFGAVRGISYSATSASASIDQNTVSAIAATNTGAVSTAAVGIIYTNATVGTVTRNKICDIRNASTGTTATAPPRAVGLLFLATGATGATASNNMISVGDSQSTNTEFIGIQNGFSTTNLNIFHNSVWVSGTAGSGALPTYGFLRGDNAAASAIATVVNIKNNIFHNTRTGGTGNHFAIGNVNTTPATGWAAGASNFNVLNSANSGTVGIWGLTGPLAFGPWITASSGDSNSLSGVAVNFVGPCDLHLNFGMSRTFIESGGTTIGVANDYDNETRPGPPGSVNGGGTAPDIGADEFDGVPGCGSAADCNDGNPCTDEACVANSCVYTNNVATCASDLNDCTTDVCSAGVCTHPAGNEGGVCTSDNNQCTDDVCVTGTCTHPNNTLPCEDNNPCTTGTTCGGGSCGTNNTDPCSDSNPCTLGDVCAGGACVPGSMPAAVQFCNAGGSTSIGQVNNPGPSVPYPSVTTVSGQQPFLCKVTVNLNSLTHTWTGDIDILLARGAPAPTSPNAMIMSDVGQSAAPQGTTNANLLLDDAAATPIPIPVVSGTFRPRDNTPGDLMPAPAPAPSGGSALSAFNGGNPNGTWNLWVNDDATGDSGTLASWCVNVVSVCTTDAQCQESPVDNPCTTNTCNLTTGMCETTNNSNTCASDGDVCTDDVCSGGACTHPPTMDGTPCDDLNGCNNPDTCQAGICTGAGANPCEDNNRCTDDTCTSSPGGPICPHQVNACDDGNFCTDDACIPGPGPYGTGCQNAPNDAPCTDGNPCTGPGGADSCNFTLSCQSGANNTEPCSDGDPCTVGDTCGGGACIPAPLSPLCPTTQFCNTAPITIPSFGNATPYPSNIAVAGLLYVSRVTVDLKGVAHTWATDVDILIAAPISTTNLVIMSDTGGGDQVPPPGGVNLHFDDTGPVLPNTVPLAGGVGGTFRPTDNPPADTFTPGPVLSGATTLSTFHGTAPNGNWSLYAVDDTNIDDGSIGGGWCVNITHPCTADVECNDSNPCTDDTCSNGLCNFANNTNSCDDGNFCNGVDTCGGGTCGHTGDPCPGPDGDGNCAESCNEATDSCDAPDVSGSLCGDATNNACTAPDTCDGAGSCVANNSPNGTLCGDAGTECTNQDTCAAGLCQDNAFKPAGTGCGDATTTACDGADTCNGGGSCQPNNAADGTFCGDAGTGCVNQDTCLAGACQDNGLQPNGTPCSDGNVCTAGDTCSAGSCSGTAVPPPAEAANLQAPDKTSYTWNATPGATRYDVLRGDVGLLPVGPGAGDETCFNDLPGPTVTDPLNPAVGSAFFYLSRGQSVCGTGTYGTQSDSSPRTSTTCP